jgi:membrane-bound lytic murein transglycosylase D
LNPVYKRNTIPDVENSLTLRLPVNKLSQFISLQENIYAESKPMGSAPLPQFASLNKEIKEGEIYTAVNGKKYEYVNKKIKKSHTVRRGETLSEIANNYDVTVSEIKKMNRLKSSKLQRGQKLSVYAWVKTKVPVKESQNVAVKKDNDSGKIVTAATNLDSSQHLIASLNEDEADSMTPDVQDAQTNTTSKTKDNAAVSKYVYHLVQPGDTLWSIAKRYEGVTVEQIKDINKLRNAHIKPGTRLKLLINS